MLDDMVWDETIVVDSVNQSSDSESDSEGDGESEHVESAAVNNNEGSSELEPETAVLNQLIDDVKKMKREEQCYGVSLHVSSSTSSSISADSTTSCTSRSKDATVVLTGQMMHAWLTPSEQEQEQEEGACTLISQEKESDKEEKS